MLSTHPVVSPETDVFPQWWVGVLFFSLGSEEKNKEEEEEENLPH